VAAREAAAETAVVGQVRGSFKSHSGVAAREAAAETAVVGQVRGSFKSHSGVAARERSHGAMLTVERLARRRRKRRKRRRRRTRRTLSSKRRWRRCGSVCMRLLYCKPNQSPIVPYDPLGRVRSPGGGGGGEAGKLLTLLDATPCYALEHLGVAVILPCDIELE
jgi:hypothetical protein